MKKIGHGGTHGGNLLLRQLGRGILDKSSREARALKRVQSGLVRALGKKSFGGLDARQQLLVETTSTLAVIVAMMTSTVMARGIFDKNGKLDRTLGKHFLAYIGSLNRTLDALFGAGKWQKKVGAAPGGVDVGALLLKGDGGSDDEDGGDE